jgi:hypothetical protein
MAYTKFEQTYVDAYLNNMYPDVEEEVQTQDTMLAASPTTEPTGQVTVSGFQPQQVRTDVQPELGVARPIPQNKAQEALGYIGELLTKAGVQLDKVGIDIPVLGRISLKDLTVGESGKVLEDMALGFYPIEGAGGFISGTTRIKPDPALELLNLAPLAGAAAKVAGKGVVKAGQAVAPKAAEMAEGYMRSIGGIADIAPVGPRTNVGNNVSELGFYSAAKEAVDAIQQPKGTGEQFLKQIEKTPGVKPDEIKWTGLDDFLKSKKTVTKAEVQEYLDKNRVEVKEVQLGDIKLNEKSEYALPEVLKVLKENQSNGYSGMRVTLANDYDAYQALTKKFPNLEDTDNWEDRVLSELIGPDAGGTKFSKYQLPGGTNYREIFMTLPTKTVTEDEARIILGASPDAKLSQADIAYASRKNKDEYIVPRAHSADGEADINRIAHMRVNDRIDADGKKVLFIEEIQSDWHQTGRKQGYKKPDLKLEDVRAEFIPPNVPEGANPDNYLGYYEVFNKKTGELVTRAGGGLSPERAIQEAIGIANATKSGVPDAPFKTTWHELALKRAIQLASEGGYDRVAFTTGKTQAERYDLSKQVDTIAYRPDGTGKFEISAIKDGNSVMTEYGKTVDDIENLVGKDIAKKIANGEGNVAEGFRGEKGGVKELSGVDLQVGGEGMKGFYDTILPKFLDKYAKKWDAKTSQMNMFISPRDGSVQIQYIDVTPKMKESVLTKGQPLFAVGGAGAAMQQEDNK